MRKVLLYFALKYEVNYKKIYEAIKNKERVEDSDIAEVESKIKCNYLTIVDPEYPEVLKQIATPPIVLFYYGDITLLRKNRIIAIIGKRKNSKYGEEMTIKIVKGLQDYNVTTISGMALGCDYIGQKCAIENNIPTIAVLGSGIDYPYPAQNVELYNQIKKEGLIISEFPNQTVPEPQNFLIRNRIIAALADDIAVMEANYKSGTMNTVAFGVDFNKEIYAVPERGNVCSGCNRLIKDGAKLIESADDIYE